MGQHDGDVVPRLVRQHRQELLGHDLGPRPLHLSAGWTHIHRATNMRSTNGLSILESVPTTFASQCAFVLIILTI